MNNRFKFRGKRLDNNEWYYGSYLYLHNAPKYDWNGTKHETKEDIHFIIGENDVNYAVNPETIGQSTGLKDKNGNLIFAGDIVTYYHNKKKLVPVTDRKPFEAPYGNDEETGLPLQYRTVKVIRYKGYVSIDAIGGMELNLRHNLHWWKSLEKDILTQVEVIGNIYENKELLK